MLYCITDTLAVDIEVTIDSPGSFVTTYNYNFHDF